MLHTEVREAERVSAELKRLVEIDRDKFYFWQSASHVCYAKRGKRSGKKELTIDSLMCCHGKMVIINCDFKKASCERNAIVRSIRCASVTGVQGNAHPT